MSNPTDLVSLGSLKPGACGVVNAFGDAPDQTTADMIDRLREIGFGEGLKVELLHQSLFGKDPIAVRVGTMTVALRRKEANLIKIKLT
ncbi:MAG: ferrous iron transport protein A [Kordiimonadaceae bacterium]|nr:ferrous iron transport protein A [Kordiimonadaceae bacterium]